MNKPPEHIEYYKQLKEEPADTTEHPLDRFSKIEQKWATPFLESDTKLPHKTRNDLIEVLKLKETALSNLRETNPEFYGMAEAKGFYATTHYNLFDNPDEHAFAKESILEFEKIACTMIRHYIRKGWGIHQADEIELQGRCFGNVQTTGARTYPHYHQDVNGVLVHYLTVGDENLDVDMEKSPRHAKHAVLFQDPRPSISYPYWEKVHAVYPRVGLTIIHPNYLWHETNPWLGQGDRVCIVVNFRIMSHGYNELLKRFRY
tara:strand:- start:777 stop:1556 length:780 start_codon:yes stop_codon:yes gene_type:complete